MNTPPTPRRLAVLACHVFEKEIEMMAGDLRHITSWTWLEMGLHDYPDNLRWILQSEIDRLEQRDDVDAIALLYGLCGLGTAGLSTRRCTLCMPRAHDCIAMLLGSKEHFIQIHNENPGTIFASPGWKRDLRIPGPDRETYLRELYAESFDSDDVEFLLDEERSAWRAHSHMCFVGLDTEDVDQDAAYARHCADCLDMQFMRLYGDPVLLEDFLGQRWNDGRFLVLEPGQRIEATPDAEIIRASPVPGA